jgi:hypothetical protein
VAKLAAESDNHQALPFSDLESADSVAVDCVQQRVCHQILTGRGPTPGAAGRKLESEPLGTHRDRVTYPLLISTLTWSDLACRWRWIRSRA